MVIKRIIYAYKPLIVLFTFFILNACVKDNLEDMVNEGRQVENEPDEEIDESAILNLVIPEGFEFNTSETVNIGINDDASNAVYTIYAYNEVHLSTQENQYLNDEGESEPMTTFETDSYNQILFSGRPVGGLLESTITLPSYYSKLYVRRKEGKIHSSVILEIVNGNATYTHTDTSGKSRRARIVEFKSQNAYKSFARKGIKIDSLYCVNGSGQLFTVNPLNGNLTDLAAMPQGSWTAAVDQDNMYLYSIGRSKPYPLMRYDMIEDSWSIIGNVGMGGPRLDFREKDGLLYFSGNNAKVYTIDPSNAKVISTWNINNLDVTNGGDLAFAEDGTLFLCTFGGLYRLDFNENNGYDATRISADNLPFTPTSMTFDSNGELWLASNGGSSDLIIMDTVTGGWEYIYGPEDGNISMGHGQPPELTLKGQSTI